MNKKPDIVSLKWVIGLMKSQADSAETALVEYGNNPDQKQALLRCMWSVHQITSTLRALGMHKGEMLTMELERALNYLYKDKIAGERSRLAMGGVMQGLKVIPAYLEHTEAIRRDSGRGLEQYVNDLRRWLGERPRPRALFFYIDIADDVGITADGRKAGDEEIRSRANVMLAPYLELAKQALRKRKVSESMVTVARISRKMQVLFAGTPAERFWFAMIGLCEGVAAGLIQPDECIAQIFKAGAFTIKRAREAGGKLDESMDFDNYLQQMLYYIAACKSNPKHIAGIREVFHLDRDAISKGTQNLVHSDALEHALGGALERLNVVVDFISNNDLGKIAKQDEQDRDRTPLDAIEGAEHRLIAAGQMAHADTLKQVQRGLRQYYSGKPSLEPSKVAESVRRISRDIIGVKLDLEHKLQHGLHSNYAGKDFELRESVATATFKQMGLVENYLHQVLRRKALKNALDKKPMDAQSLLRLTTALQRHLNKTDKGHEELRQLIREADNGEADIEALYRMARDYQNQLEPMPERKAIDGSLALMRDIADALMFTGMKREGQVMEQCHQWLAAASAAGSVHEDEAFRCFADAFAQIEMHLQRSLLDPLDDTSHMLALAEQRAAKLAEFIAKLPPGRSSPGATEGATESEHDVQDAEIPAEFRDVFIEESEEIVNELGELTTKWLQKPEVNEMLRDIRRHFHTFKGNGRAVGANVLGELGWAAQDMLDRSLEGDLYPTESMQKLVREVVSSLPALVGSYANSEGPDVERIRKLTRACFAMAAAGDQDDVESLPEIAEVLGAAVDVPEESPVLAAKTVTH